MRLKKEWYEKIKSGENIFLKPSMALRLILLTMTIQASFSNTADIISCAAIITHAEEIDLDKAVADCLEKNRKRAEGTGDKL